MPHFLDGARRHVCAAIAIVTLSAACIPTAAAHAGSTETDVLLSQAPGNVGDLAPDDQMTAHSATASQVLDAESGELTITPKSDEALSPVTISLPIEGTPNIAQLPDGTVQLDRSSDDGGTYAQTLADGSVRTLTTIPDAAAPTTFTYTVDLAPNQELVALPDGGVSIAETQDDGLIAEVVSANSPWAKDKNGNSVPTWYEVRDNEIIQHVDTTGAAFPIVADPTWSRSGVMVQVPGYALALASVYLNKRWSADYKTGSNTVCGVATGLVSLATGPGGVAFGIACVLHAGMWDVATNHGYCAALDFHPGLPQWQKVRARPYKSSFCR